MLTDSCLSLPTFVPPLSLLPVIGYHQRRRSGLLNAVWGYRNSPSGSKLQLPGRSFIQRQLNAAFIVKSLHINLNSK